ncbi:unnamed protein product [Medioppia subpectinata]|uniref:Upstream activation factor subunit spp27 n=1 Tax=Medioppia subpectinata TaxID=1979941 RepID=A0A7R9PYV2_9ACAR|nr:unnamed protein product [Medioppia subpectinata]CAG2105790.1 unnamed protein product [Medioppia subpectinata]
MSETDISEEVLIKSIREILVSADLNVMTAKLVRNELKAKLNVDNLDSQKKQINSIISDVINELNQTNKDKDNGVKKKDVKKEIKEEVTEKAKEAVESDKESDDSSSDEDITDEGLARKLHNEELDSKRRVTRNNRTTKKSSSAKKTKKTKKKDNSDDSDEEKPKKQRKNGYLKPCVLSTELADFFGESEMARHEVVKRIWSYVKENNLQDPKNKQFTICDDQLLKIFGRKRFRMFGMMKILAKHLN